MDDLRPAVRGFADSLIGSHKANAAVVRKLTAHLADPSLYVQAEAAGVLLKVSPNPDRKRIKAIFREALRQYGSPACEAAVFACGKLGREGKDLVPELIKVIEHPKCRWWRASAVYSIGQLKPTDVKVGGYLLPLLADKQPFVASSACIALEAMGEVAVPVLITGLTSDSEQTQSLAIQALGRIGEKAVGAIPFLLIRLEAAKQENWGGMSKLIQTALGKIAANPVAVEAYVKDVLSMPTLPRESEAKVAQWITDLGSDTFAVRERASRELLNIGKSVIFPLQRALSSTDDLERKRRIKHLLSALVPIPELRTADSRKELQVRLIRFVAQHYPAKVALKVLTAAGSLEPGPAEVLATTIKSLKQASARR
jgi:HEAT repeat protein